MTPTQAEIETVEQLLENYVLGKLPPDTTAEEYFAQALADARESVERDAEQLMHHLDNIREYAWDDCLENVVKEAEEAMTVWREKHGGHPK